MSARDYAELGELPDRTELIDGVVVMSPSPARAHNELLAEILFQLKAFARGNAGIRVFPETDLYLKANSVYRPDLAAYRAGRLPPVIERLTLPPDLIVEVLSPATKALDLITKRDDYEAFGVAEYWAADPVNGAIRCWRRQGAALAEMPAQGGSLASDALPGFVLDLAALARIVRG